MAYFSKLGKGNVVEEVYVINDDIATSEQAGIDFIHNLYNINSVIKQTFIDGSQRKNYGGVGYKYDQTRDAFIPPRIFLSWVLNEETCQWEPPIAKPQDGKIYIWNETTKQWDLNE